MKNENLNHLYKESSEGGQARRFKRLWSVYAYHWPLFLISITICVVLAVIYIQNSIPEYLVQAKIAINDSKKDQMSDAKAALDKLDILPTPKVIESEVAIIKSRALIRTVVHDLKLWANYQVPYRLTYKDLYDESPVNFKLLGPMNPMKEAVNLDIVVENDRFFLLKQGDGEPKRFAFNTPLRNKFGRWTLQKTKSLNDYIGKDVRITIADPEAVISDYTKNINVVLDRNAPLVDLQISDPVAKRGKQILNMLVLAYKNINIDYKNQETKRTLQFIDDRLASLTDELSGAEKNVEDYKSSIGLTDISSQSQLYLDNIQTNDTKMNEVNIQLNVIREIEAFVNSDSQSAVPATIGIADPGLVSLVEQLTTLELQMNKNLATTPEDNPIFVPIVSQITSVKKAIKNKVASIKSSLLATRAQLRSNSSNFESSIRSIPGQERQYVSIKRQQGIKENLYVYLLQKREEIAMSYASTLTDARTVEDAFYETPMRSKKTPLGIALLCGFIAPISFISLRKALRNKVMTKEEIAQSTAVPIICELTHTKDRNAVVVMNRKNYAIGEQLRLLRTNLLQVEHTNDLARVTLFTSSKAGEGKSFVASNIGASLAATGKRTIILEMDLRRPKISSIFKMDMSRPGISDYLQGKATLEEIIQPSGMHEDLFVAGCGSIPANPSELLQSEAVQVLIDNLKLDFDNVLIDTPPMRLVTDASILAPYCDVSLYIVRHNYTDKSELDYVEDVYESNKLKNMHIVFNGVQMDERFGYSVDWGYYADNDPSEKSPSIFTDLAARF